MVGSMQQRVAAATPRALSLGVAVALAAAGCSFDSSASPHANDERPLIGQDARALDARTDVADDATAAPPELLPDAEAQSPIHPPAQPPEPSAPTDARVNDADAAEAPDGGEPCVRPGPCVCPHQVTEDAAADCGPALCPVHECAPDRNCRFAAFKGNGYYFCDDIRTWLEAHESCAKIANAHLAVIDSADEDQFVFEQLSDTAWLGGNDGNREGVWRWVTGRTFYERERGPVSGAFTNWLDYEPNNTGAGMSMTPPDCLMYWHPAEAWADASCGDRHGYVCELESVP
jgi:hypothetical protein